MSKKLNAKLIHKGMGGGSNQRIFRKVIDWTISNPKKLQNTLFLIQWSYAGRNEVFYCGPMPDADGKIVMPPEDRDLLEWHGNWYNAHFGHDGYTNPKLKDLANDFYFNGDRSAPNPFYLPNRKILSDVTCRYAISLQSIFKLKKCKYIMFQGHIAPNDNRIYNFEGEIDFNNGVGEGIDRKNWIMDYGLRDYVGKENLTPCEHANIKGNKMWAEVLYNKYKELYL